MKQTTERKGKKRLALLLLLIAFIIILGATVAFFSDFITAQITATAGTLRLEGGEITGNQHFQRPGVEGGPFINHSYAIVDGLIANLNPGDIIELNTGVQNVGNKSAWVRNIVNLTIGTNHANVVPEAEGRFELFQFPATTSTADALTAIRTRVLTNRIAVSGTTGGFPGTGQIGTPIIMNGTGTAAEEEEGGLAPNQSMRLFLYFVPTVGTDVDSNRFQGSEIALTIRTEAMQFRNNPTPTWLPVSTQTVRTVPVAPVTP
ncbi:MAG: hypothetical protein FWC68_06315 [Oscillospiraceae bacterium]|nr:hypothetical protein [Oscillospiraceae bacterium]